MASHTLEDTRTNLKGRMLWLTRKIVREPLSGLVDGSNKVFHLPYAPAQDDSVVVYDNAGSTVATSAYTVDEEAGSVVFGTAISTAYTADFTFQALTDTALLSLCKEGFDTMQRLYPRDLYLVSSGGSLHISSTTGTVSDPSIGSSTFSASRKQQDLLMICCEEAVVKALIQQSAMEAIDVREGITGMRMDRTRRTQALETALGVVQDRIEQAVYAAAEEAGDSTVFEGGVVPGARSDIQIDWFDWWTDGQQDRGVVS